MQTLKTINAQFSPFVPFFSVSVLIQFKMGDNEAIAAQLAGIAGIQPAQLTALSTLFQQLGVNQQQQRANQLAHVKNVPCSTYTIGQDFDVWCITFMDNIRACYNLAADDPRLPGLFIQWISTKLAPGATRAAFENLPDATKANWALLKPALSDCYTDQKEKIVFLSRLDAHQRQPGQSLRTYKDTLLLKMEKYQPALKGVPDEWRRTGLQRFREGIRNHLLRAHLLLNCPTDSASIEDAFSTAMAWENTVSTLSNDVREGGNDGLVSALLGLPTVEATQSVTPRMAAMSTSEASGFDRRLDALETKMRTGELQMAEVKDSVSSIKAGMEQMSIEIQQGFGSLRRELTPQRQQYAPRQNYAPQQYAPRQNYAAQQYTPAFRDQRQPHRQPFPAQPRLISGLTQGSSYVNNTLMGARRPAAPYQNQFQSGPQGQHNQQAQNQATIGAMEETEPKTEVPTSTFVDTAAMGNTGHGWQAFPGAEQPEGYDSEPLGIHAFVDGGSFQQPAASPQGPPLA